MCKIRKVVSALLPVFFLLVAVAGVIAQDRPQGNASTQKSGPKPYHEIVTEKAQSDDGFFRIHRIDDKYLFEIPDSLIGREWMSVVRIAKTTNGIGYGGEEHNSQLLRWEKLPDHKIALRVVSTYNIANEANPISMAVKSSNTEAIAASFDVKAYTADGKGVVLDVTDFLKSDNPVFGIQPGEKRAFGLTAQLSDRSFINSVRSYPKNVELRSTKTFSTAPVSNPRINITDASNVGIITLELNTSLVMLPKVPMQRRFADDRIGYFSTRYTNYGLDAHRTKTETFINRWRLEAKPEDYERMKRGELVEPINPIVYYIDPATPVKWRKYLKLGIEDWAKAFEKAGFKNAIVAKDFPENDTTIHPEDIRFSMIRYFASDIPNAYGPQTVDPRSGEVLQSQIGWYHNVMQLVHDWYFIQAAMIDPRAQKPKFDDELMGDLIRFVSSHEVGHTLGIMHNFGSSSSVPVENLRKKEWVEKYGHTPSIMDYARFNYVAQPEDNISPIGIYPRINDYDHWAIEFGYKPAFGKNEYEDKLVMNELIKERLKDKRLIYLRQHSPSISPNFPDPRGQNEDLGDNAMLAGEYGIKNLKRLVPNLPKWLKEPAEDFEQVDELYGAVRSQFVRYVGHVLANVGGIYETRKTMDQEGPDVFVPVPESRQREAMDFLKRHIFTTPSWLYDFSLLKQFNQDQVVDEVRAMQDGFINNLFNVGRFARIIDNTAQLGNDTYTLTEFIGDVRKNIWSELYEKKDPDWYKRSFQKTFIERMKTLIANPPFVDFPPGLRVDNPRRYYSKFYLPFMDINRSDVLSVFKANLRTLQKDIKTALPLVKDGLVKAHYEDVLDRITDALDTKEVATSR